VEIVGKRVNILVVFEGYFVVVSAADAVGRSGD
jgi:hypothetical protein